MADFLLEIGLEEIPARMIDGGREELSRRVSELLSRENLGTPTLESYSTPRRLAVIVKGIAAAQADVKEEVTGPATKIAFKDGVPTPAAEAFAKKAGVAVEKLGRVTNAKGEYLVATIEKKGRAAAEVLAEALPKEIAAIYWAKNMYWRGKTAERYVRPVRWMVAILDGKEVAVEFGGVKAGSETRGHRILSTGGVKLKSADEYAAALGKAKVIVSSAEREHQIRKALDAATREVPGARWREDAELLKTVVNLTEFPSVILGSFDKSYLTLPEEVLVTVMRDHQKYFAVEDANGELAPYFLAVLNTDGDPGGLIRHGNERVLRARFNDARFFWDTDQKIPLRDRVEKLKNVTFQKDLGSYYDKANRISHLVTIGGADLDSPNRKINRNALYEAAWLAKADLTTELVKEFTELQGIVGGLYAKAQGMSPAIADAIYDHYKPESMEEAAPKTLESAVLALADKADTIAGMFALGLQPTGSKDPFALRRQANGIVKIIVEHNLPVDVLVMLQLALVGYKGSEAEKKFKSADLEKFTPALQAFFRERQEFYLREVCGTAYDVANAVLAAGAERPADVALRAKAVSAVRESADFEPIAVAFKRIKNILRQAREAGKPAAAEFTTPSVTEPEERALAEASGRIALQVAEHRKKRNYGAALAEIAKLRPVLDTFFDKVMVMVEEERVRANRLALLEQVLRDFSTIADFSEIVTEKK
ncbi:MAG TPA: glycine--tRNA ligase subunit beta [Terriglobales bacterium]|nr:glycine--tRNA ligase subunit beta [Terriglobales bacterium]